MTLPKKLKLRGNEIKIFCDGSSSTKLGSCLCVLIDRKNKWNKNKKYIITKTFNTNMPVNEIEYLALIEALHLANTITSKEIKIFTDRIQIAEELDGTKLGNPQNLELYFQAKSLLKDNIKIFWIHRKENLAGKYLDKRLKKITNYLKNTTH
jgi:ribonuclease HI